MFRGGIKTASRRAATARPRPWLSGVRFTVPRYARWRRWKRCPIARPLGVAGEKRGEGLCRLHPFVPLTGALNDFEKGPEGNGRKREAVTDQIAGPGNRLVQHVDLRLHGREDCIDRSAVRFAVGALGKQIAEDVTSYQTRIDCGVDERYPLLDLGSSACVIGDQLSAGEGPVDVGHDGLRLTQCEVAMAHDGYLSERVDGQHLGTVHPGWHEIVWHLFFLKGHADNPDVARKRRSDDLNPVHHGFLPFCRAPLHPIDRAVRG